MKKIAVMEGSLAVAHAIRQAAPKVVSAYPISPQTHIVEEIAKFFANGEMKGKYIRVDSEFSRSVRSIRRQCHRSALLYCVLLAGPAGL